MRRTVIEFLRYLWHITPWTIYFEEKLIVRKMLNLRAGLTLDAGCGKWGSVARIMINKGKMAIGVDKEREIDNKLLKNERFRYLAAKVENLPFKNNLFDQIACISVMEHVKHDILLARELGRVLKDKGELLVVVPSDLWRFPYYKFMKPFAPSEAELMNIFGHVRKGYKLETLVSLFKGFEVEEVSYYLDSISALGYDIQHARHKIIKNILLRLLAIPLFFNLITSSPKIAMQFGVRLRKIKKE